jgi:epoxyqueuosine reductase
VDPYFVSLTEQVKAWGVQLGFQQIGVSDTDLGEHEPRLQAWLDAGYAGDMAYMSAHGIKRTRPAELIPGTCRVITARMDYLPGDALDARDILASDSAAYISRYALGRDYHKVLRRRLAQLWQRVEDQLEADGRAGFRGRVFTDSAPVLEKALAQKSGLGWIGKHTLLLNRSAGSWFFLGDIYTDVPLIPTVDHTVNLCGSCSACIDVCPTRAIVAPYVLDARRCISYLTIELKGAIPVEFRHAIGNRIFGCDDCQSVCPWNKYARLSGEPDFQPRHGLDHAALLELFAWTEQEFLQRTEGSAIRRAGYEGWLRNIAVALGNGAATESVITTLKARRSQVSSMVQEHIDWALAQLV